MKIDMTGNICVPTSNILLLLLYGKAGSLLQRSTLWDPSLIPCDIRSRNLVVTKAIMHESILFYYPS